MASSNLNGAMPLDLSHHYAKATRHRGNNNLKAFYKYFMIPGIGNMAGGLPNVAFFPYDTLEAQIAKPDRWTPTPNGSGPEATGKNGQKTPSEPMASSHITVPKITDETDLSKKIDLFSALQYGQAVGYLPLASFIRQFTRDHLHPNVPYVGGPETIPTIGSTDGFNKVVEMIVDPWLPEVHAAEDRPHMLCEVFVYPAVLNQTVHKGVRPVPIEIDGQGMMADGPGGLREVLENWDPRNGRRPHFMYSVTMGHNPTSGVLSLERRKAIYELCQEYDIIIVEDDPYWYMQFPSAVDNEARSRNLPLPQSKPPVRLAKSSGYDFLDSLVQSYLSIDIDGRVIRLDTFSKTIAPGCRLGWITAQPRFIEILTRITETMTQQPSGFVQSMVAETIMGKQPETVSSSFFSLSSRDQLKFNGWSMDGWVRWLEGLRGAYEKRMNRMCAILDEQSYQLKQSTPVKHTDADWGVITKTQILSFDWPRGGMFLWLRVHFENHPLWQTKGKKIPVFDGPNLATGLFMLLTHKPFLVLGAPGSMFSANPSIAGERGWQFVRLCFAAEAEEEVGPCSERFGKGLQKFWKIKADEMEDLIREYSTESAATLDEVSNIGYYSIGC